VRKKREDPKPKSVGRGCRGKVSLNKQKKIKVKPTIALTEDRKDKRMKTDKNPSSGVRGEGHCLERDKDKWDKKRRGRRRFTKAEICMKGQ